MAGRIPQSFINELLARVDIVDVIERRVPIKKKGKNYSGLCPFHDEKTPSFSVSPEKQFYHCFGCQESGTALTFLMKFERMEFVEAVEALAEQVGIPVQREAGGRPVKRIDPSLYDVLKKASTFYKKALRGSPKAIDYLKSRGLTGEVAARFQIGYAPPGWQNLTEALSGVASKLLADAGLTNESDRGRVYDRFRDRVIFPIHDLRGRVIGFGGRAFGDDDGPKYLNSPETEIFHKGQELYGLYEARNALTNLDRVIVVEGYMDVVALAQFDVSNAVATLGTASGTAHFEKLFRQTDEVVCCFDGDKAGRAAAWKALENALPSLSEHRQLRFMFLPDGTDPDSFVRDAGKAAFLDMVERATPAMEFLIARQSEGVDLESIDGRARFVAMVQPLIERLPQGVLRTLMERRVGELSGLTPRQEPRRPRPVASADSGVLSRLSERLLTLIIQHPEFWSDVDSDVRAALIEHTGDLDDQADARETLLNRALAYLHAHPETDAEEFLVVLADDSLAERLARRPLPLKGDAIATELKDACTRYLDRLVARARQRSLSELKVEPNDDRLRKYWQQRNPGQPSD